MVGAHRDRVAESQGAAGAPQLAGAVDLVGGEERADPVRVGPGEHGGGQGRFGGEGDLPGHARQVPAFVVAGPLPGQVEATVDDGVPERGGEGEVDRDLAQADPAQGAGVLPGRAHRVGGRLCVPGLVRDQHAVTVVQLGHSPGSGFSQDGFVVPDRAGQQVLEPVRARMPKRLGQRPAVGVR